MMKKIISREIYNSSGKIKKSLISLHTFLKTQKSNGKIDCFLL